MKAWSQHDARREGSNSLQVWLLGVGEAGNESFSWASKQSGVPLKLNFSCKSCATPWLLRKWLSQRPTQDTKRPHPDRESKGEGLYQVTTTTERRGKVDRKVYQSQFVNNKLLRGAEKICSLVPHSALSKSASPIYLQRKIDTSDISETQCRKACCIDAAKLHKEPDMKMKQKMPPWRTFC